MFDLKEYLLKSCKVCGGRGFASVREYDIQVSTEKCKCMKKYAYLYPILEVGFPLEDILLEADDRSDEAFELQDSAGYYKRAFEGSKQFIANGAGLILFGSGWSPAVVKLLAKMEEVNMPLMIGFNSMVYDAEVLVLSLAFDLIEIPKVIERRVKSLKPTIVCFESLKEAEKHWDILDTLGWSGDEFNGPVFRAVQVSSTLKDDRWK